MQPIETPPSDTPSLPYETFPLLASLPGLSHLFIRRIPHLEIAVDRAMALERLAEPHRKILREHGLERPVFATGEQVHRAEVAVLAAGEPTPEFPIRGVDALVTNRRDVTLGIYVADCAAVYFVDRETGALGLAHAGKKGVHDGIAARTIRTMQLAFGTKPADLIVQISPCIRPPHYEVDFASDLARQLLSEGAGQVEDCFLCTASHPELYYSYRRDKARTGRMLAALAWRDEAGV